MINIGLLGLGTVGTGILEILKERNNGIRVSKVLVNDINKKRDIDLNGAVITSDFNEILCDESISIITEVTSSVEQGYEYIKSALNSGKHVVTANKAVVSGYYEELSSLAKENNRAFLYEASVGGGIPIIKPLREQVELNEIISIQGILNGTCNYILTKMFDENLNYDQALKMAQELGYSEADPSADVDGYDTLRKLRILGTLGFQGSVRESDIQVSGIRGITAFDVEQIKKMDCTVKLIGEMKAVENEFTAAVQPVLIKKNSYFSNVNMSFNSIVFKGSNVGELKFYGLGAGKLPTATAVLNDILDIVNNSYRKSNPLGGKVLKNANHKQKERYYLRISDFNAKKSDRLKYITEKLLYSSENTAVITKEVLYDDILNLVAEPGLSRYFAAKIPEGPRNIGTIGTVGDGFFGNQMNQMDPVFLEETAFTS